MAAKKINAKALANAREAYDAVCSLNSGKNDVAAFLASLRPLGPDFVILDLCNFLAHAEGRDKGHSQSRMESFAGAFVDALEQRTGVEIPGPLFVKDDVVKRIASFVQAAGITADPSSFLAAKENFVRFLLEWLDGCDFILKNPKVKDCRIVRDNGEAFAAFHFQNLAATAAVRRDGPGATMILLFTGTDREFRPFVVTMT